MYLGEDGLYLKLGNHYLYELKRLNLYPHSGSF